MTEFLDVQKLFLVGTTSFERSDFDMRYPELQTPLYDFPLRSHAARTYAELGCRGLGTLIGSICNRKHHSTRESVSICPEDLVSVPFRFLENLGNLSFLRICCQETF